MPRISMRRQRGLAHITGEHVAMPRRLTLPLQHVRTALRRFGLLTVGRVRAITSSELWHPAKAGNVQGTNCLRTLAISRYQVKMVCESMVRLSEAGMTYACSRFKMDKEPR